MSTSVIKNFSLSVPDVKCKKTINQIAVHHEMEAITAILHTKIISNRICQQAEMKSMKRVKR